MTDAQTTKKRMITDSEEVVSRTPSIPHISMSSEDRRGKRALSDSGVDLSEKVLASQLQSNLLGNICDKMEVLNNQQTVCMAEVSRLSLEIQATNTTANKLMLSLDQVLSSLAISRDQLGDKQISIDERITSTRQEIQEHQNCSHQNTMFLHDTLEETQRITEQEFPRIHQRERSREEKEAMALKNQQLNQQEMDWLASNGWSSNWYDSRYYKHDWDTHYDSRPTEKKTDTKAPTASWDFVALPEKRSSIVHETPPVSMINVNITEPPVFDGIFEIYRKELIWWRDIHNTLPGSQLISVLAVKTKQGPIKGLLVQFMDSTRGKSDQRTFEGYLALLDQELARSSQELIINKLAVWNSLSRKNEESIRNFWIRFGRVRNSLVRSGISFPPAVTFYKAIASMRLNPNQLGLLMSTIESRELGNSLPELKRLSIEILEASLLEQTESILQANTTEDSHDGDDNCSLGDTEENAEAQPSETLVTNNGVIYELRKAKSSTGRNRPGAKDNAIRNSRVSYDLKKTSNVSRESQSTANIDESKAHCWRRNGIGHTWGKCHLPWQKVLAFGTRVPGGRGSSPQDKVLLVNADSLIDPTPDKTLTGIETRKSIGSGVEVIETNEAEEPVSEEKLTQSEWVDRWGNLDDIFLISNDDAMPLSMEAANPATEIPLCYFQSQFPASDLPVIDSGATGSIIGELWLGKNSQYLEIKNRRKSQKTFRFGDSRVFRVKEL